MLHVSEKDGSESGISCIQSKQKICKLKSVNCIVCLL